MVERATGLPPHPESVELDFTLCPWLPAAQPRTAVDLLRPEYAAVPFQGFERELGRLHAWCRQESLVSAMVLSGSAGQGKTRIARELATLMGRDGWATGMLTAAEPAGWLDAVVSTGRPLLLVVDDAAGRSAQVAKLIDQLAQRSPGHRVRILLLARSAELCLSRLATALGVGMMAVNPEPMALPCLAPDPGGRRAEYHRAASAFASRLGRLPDAVAVDAVVPDELPEALRAAESASTVTLHAAVLARLLGGDPRGGPDTTRTLLAVQMRSWEQAASQLPGEVRHRWRQAITLAVLCGAEHRSEAADLLAQVNGASGPIRRDEWQILADWVRMVLPPPDPWHQYWGSLPADLVAHFLAAQVADLTLLVDLLPRLTDRRAQTALARIAEAAGVSADLARQLTALLVAEAGLLAPVAVRAACHGERSAPLLTALDELGEAAIDLADCERIAAEIPDPAGPLARLAVILRGVLVAHYREAAESDPRTGWAALGAALVARSLPLAELGRHHDAAAATAEAVAGYRVAGRAAAPAVVRSTLVAALRVHAGHVAAAGRFSEALETLDEAAVECERLPEVEAGRQLAEIAGAMAALARRWAAAAGTAASASAAQRAVDSYRSLPPRRQEELLTDVDTALAGLGVAHLTTGDLPRAIAAFEESTAVCRRLARRHGGAYRLRLATALDRLAAAQFRAGRENDAASSTEDAVGLHRQLVEQWSAQLPALATRARILSSRLAAAGRHQQALAAADEAVACCTQLVHQHERRYAGPAADAVHTRAIRLAEVGRWQAALDAATDAVAGYRRLSQGGTGYVAALAAALTNLSVILAECGWHHQSEATGQEAIRTYRGLVEAGRDGYVPHLALALNNHVVRQSSVASSAETLAMAEEAVDLYRSSALAGDQRFRDGYAVALGTLARNLAAADRVNDGVVVAQQALAILQRLAAENPRAYQPHQIAALLELSADLARAQLWAQGAACARQAVDASRAMLAAQPAADHDHLATALRLLAQNLLGNGRPDEAIVAGEERVALRRSLADAASGAAGMAALADALEDLGRLYAAGNRSDEAVATGRESVQLWTDLASQAPRNHLHRLAGAWRALSRRLAEARPTAADPEALSAAERAVVFSRRLAPLNPDAYLRQLASSLRLLAQHLAVAGSREASVATAQEAADLYARLAREDPAQFEPEAAAARVELAAIQVNAKRVAQGLTSTPGSARRWRTRSSSSRTTPPLCSGTGTAGVPCSKRWTSSGISPRTGPRGRWNGMPPVCFERPARAGCGAIAPAGGGRRPRRSRSTSGSPSGGRTTTANAWSQRG